MRSPVVLLAFFACYMTNLLGNSASGAACPGGNESTLASVDNSVSGHSRKRYAYYPWFWDKCVEPVEQATSAPFDNRQQRIFSGNVLEIDKSCTTETTTNFSQSWSYSVEFSASTTGSLTVEEKAELGWKLADTLSGSGSSSVSGTVGWQVGRTDTLTMSGTISLTIPPGTFYREDGYVTMEHSKAAKYTYVVVDVWDYCTTHGVWSVTPYHSQLDIYSMSTATHKQPIAGGVAGTDCTGCGCTPPAFPGGAPVTVGPPKTFTAGQNWYHGSP